MPGRPVSIRAEEILFRGQAFLVWDIGRSQFHIAQHCLSSLSKFKIIKAAFALRNILHLLE